MAAKALVWLLAALVAGCVSPVDAPEDEAPSAPQTQGSGFDRSVAGRYDNDQREAFIAVSPDGRALLTCAHGDFVRASFMYASTDAGETWTELAADPDPRAGGDCEVAISEAGVWAFLHSTVAGATVATTADQGATWTVNPLSAVPVGGMADRPWLEYSGERLLLSFQPGPLEPGAIGFRYSDDHGSSWSVPRLLTAPALGATHPKSGGFVLGPDGEVRVPISAALEDPGLGLASKSFFVVSRNRGETWVTEAVTTPGAAHHFPAAAQDGAGNLYWLYERHMGGLGLAPSELWLTTSIDGGVSWGEPVVVEPDPLWPRPWMHGRPDGTADLLWQRATDGGEGKLLWMRVGPGGDAVANATLASLPEFLEYAEIGHEASGRAFIAASAREREPSEIHVYREAVSR